MTRTHHTRRLRTESRGRAVTVRPLVESLEDRRLLAAGALPALVGFDALKVDAQSYEPSRILVQYRTEASATATVAGTAVGAGIGLVPGLHEVALGPGVSVDAAVRAYRADPNVLAATPDYRVHVLLSPNDPQYGSQWALNNTGQSGGVAGTDVHAERAWDTTTGSTSVTVAVIDTGVDYNHPDLYQNIWVNQKEIPAQWKAGANLSRTVTKADVRDVDGDGLITFRDLNDPKNAGLVNDTNGDGRIDAGDLLRPVAQGGWGDGSDAGTNGYADDLIGWNFVASSNDPMDDFGHGTHVSGILAASGNNAVGVAGIAWKAQLMPLKFLDAGGNGSTGDALLALNYAVANGARISNNSWGGGGADDLFRQALVSAGAAGHVFVAAAGNDSNNNDAFPAYPAGYAVDNLIAVAATDRRDTLASFSNFGAATVHVAAPGVDVLSTMLRSGPLSDPSGYGVLSGTSMATPHVAGVAALIRTLHPDWSPAQVINQIVATADPVSILAGRTLSNGRLNAAAAVGSAVPDTHGPRVVGSSPSGSTVGAVAAVRLTFNKPVGSFTNADIDSLTGPGGAITGATVSPVAGSGDRSFDVTFASQSVKGDYTLVVGPHVKDKVTPTPNEMDQNGNGVNGEDPGDRFAAKFSIGDTIVITSGDTPLNIRDFQTTVSTIQVNQDVAIAKLTVQVDITHGADGDLMFGILSPSGAGIILSGHRGGSGHDFQGTVFDDAAPTSLFGGAPPFAGTYRPENQLASVNGQNAKGTWRLIVQDTVGGHEGTLNFWQLRIVPVGGGGVNRPPVAVDDTAATAVDKPVTVNVLANDSDPDGDPLTVSLVRTSNGTAVVNADQTVTFTPANRYVGPAGFVYEISDGRGGTARANVAITVTAVNRPPVAVDDSVTTRVDTPLTLGSTPGPYYNLLANDSDPDGDPLTLTAVANPSHGAVRLASGGTVVFTPDVGFLGQAGFDYTISDGKLTASAHVTVQVTGVNHAPVAVDDTATTAVDKPVTVNVLANDSDPDGDPLTVSLVSTSHGKAVVNADQTVTFTPDSRYVGAAGFTYEISDGRGGTARANVAVTVTAVNRAPVAVDDAVTTPVNTPITLGSTPGPYYNLLANDSDQDGDPLTLTAVANPSHGTVRLASGGTVVFTPAAGFSGTAGFDYTISDGKLTASAHVIVGVRSLFYLAPHADGTLTNSDGTSLAVTRSDVVRLSTEGTGPSAKFTYSLYFHGADVGLGDQAGENIDAFTFLSDGSLLVSTGGNYSVKSYGITFTGGGEDILHFSPTAYGARTAGTWDPFFKGSKVGLSGAAGNVDALALLPDGSLLLSTAGNVSVAGVTTGDTDLLAFRPRLLGQQTSGTWSLYFKGSRVGLTDPTSHRIDALFVGPPAATGGKPTLFLSTFGSGVAGGVSRTGVDVVPFLPTALGQVTAGSWGPGLALQGSLYGLTALGFDGIWLGPAPQAYLPPGAPPPAGGPLAPAAAHPPAPGLDPAAVNVLLRKLREGRLDFLGDPFQP